MRTNKLAPEDFAGTTASITNPGMIGTVHSVPRLMPGQGFIIGVGTIAYPAEYEGADPHTVARLAVSKVFTLTSTYDHRIIQGAESGEFLRWMHHLLLGNDGFYDEIFQSFGVPYEPARWSTDVSPLDDPNAAFEKVVSVHSLVNMYRVRGHLIANLDPLGRRPPHTHPELDVQHYGLTIWDLDREFPAGGLGSGALGRKTMPLRDILGILRDAYSRTIGVEYMHIQEPEQKEWIQARVETPPTPARRPAAAPHPRAPERGRGLRRLHPHEVPGPEAVQPRRRREPHPDARRAAERRRPTRAWPRSCWAPRTAAASTCSSTRSGRATGRSSASSRARSIPRRCRGPAT